MNSHEIAELKIGDEVGVAESSGTWGRLRICGIHKLVKRNGHGHLFLEGVNAIFDKYGKQRGDSRYGKFLMRADLARGELEARRLRAARTAACTEIDTLLKGLRAGNGEINSPLSRETEEKILQQLAKMRQ